MISKEVLMSILMIGVVAMAAGAGTFAYFSDTEESTENVFAAGTIDISVNKQNPWNESFTLKDLKPCETAVIELTITNEGTNPANISKHLIVTGTAGGLHPESESAEDSNDTINNIDDYIWFDLYVEVYNETGGLVYSKEIYDLDEVNVSEINCTEIELGILNPGWYMLVEQSFHMHPEVTNWAQGDEMYFDEEIIARQIAPTV
ncbi:hypothetical protein DRN97_11860 [Methanosarcinales archaeon]|nr:MAG: hypothetical protein DRN97_11860 [Methanosarcinales archaeon]